MDATVVYDVFHLNYWDWRIACTLFFGGLGVGAYLFGIFISWYYKDQHAEVTRLGAVLEPLAVLTAILFLMSEMGQPLRVPYLIFSYHPTSPLWWGGWFQMTFLTLAVLYARLWIRNRPEEVAQRKLIGWCGVPFALIVGGYYGFLMTAVKARPLWNAGPSTVTAMLGFVITGIAAIVLLLTLSRKRELLLGSIRLTRNILGVALLLQLFTVGLWVVTMANGPQASAQALAEMNRHYGLLFWGGAVGVGLALPLAVGAMEVLRERRLQAGVVSVSVPIATSVMALVGAYIFRYVLLMAGQAY